MLNMIERMKRGGLCFVGSQRHTEANNPYCDNYDPSKPTVYITYFDANNLYGGAMSEFLPYDDLRWNNNLTLEDILTTEDNAEEGHIVEVDLHFPSEIHDKLKEFPPAPENIVPNVEWFSEFQKELGRKTGTIKKMEHITDHLHEFLICLNIKIM